MMNKSFFLSALFLAGCVGAADAPAVDSRVPEDVADMNSDLMKEISRKALESYFACFSEDQLIAQGGMICENINRVLPAGGFDLQSFDDLLMTLDTHGFREKMLFFFVNKDYFTSEPIELSTLEDHIYPACCDASPEVRNQCFRVDLDAIFIISVARGDADVFRSLLEIGFSPSKMINSDFAYQKLSCVCSCEKPPHGISALSFTSRYYDEVVRSSSFGKVSNFEGLKEILKKMQKLSGASELTSGAAAGRMHLKRRHEGPEDE